MKTLRNTKVPFRMLKMFNYLFYIYVFLLFNPHFICCLSASALGHLLLFPFSSALLPIPSSRALSHQRPPFQSFPLHSFNISFHIKPLLDTPLTFLCHILFPSLMERLQDSQSQESELAFFFLLVTLSKSVFFQT